jgi:hypothetical protein
MFESDFDIGCDNVDHNDCDFLLDSDNGPPIFNIPPPPRPDFLHEIEKCSENSLSDYEMCEAIPVS